MKREAFRLKLGEVLSKRQRFGKLELAPGDQVIYSVNVDELTRGELELFTLTANLGLITLMDSEDSEVIAMQHHLVNSMEEVADDFADVIAAKADEALKKVIKDEFDGAEDWRLNILLIHFREIVRQAIWEKMDAPEPVFKKASWWRRVLTKVRHLTRGSYDERDEP